jgi:hypothetical protein
MVEACLRRDPEFPIVHLADWMKGETAYHIELMTG